MNGTTLITDKPAILNRWAEHISAVLDRPGDINAEAIARLPQVETDTDLDRPLSEEKVKKAMKQLSSGKAPGADAIPAEVYRHGGDTLLQKLTDLFHRMWDEEVIPQQLKDVFIICLYKNGNRQLCDNYRGISLLAIAGKILATVLLNRLIVHLEPGLLPESQSGFRGGRGTFDMIFAASQLQEKCQEQYDDLFITFIDLTKAFDTVCRDGLWQIMEKFGCPRKFRALARQLHDGMRATVIDNGDTSDSFPVTNGVKEGCVLAPTKRNVTKRLNMPDIGDLLTSRSAACIQLLTDTLLRKKKIVLIIIAIVLSFEVDGDVSLIYHKRIDFCKKTKLVRLFPFQYLS